MDPRTDPIALLEEQHREVEELFVAFEKADAFDKERIFLDLADALFAHTLIEERHLYPLAHEGDAEALVRDAVDEHLAMKRSIAKLLDLDGADAGYALKVKQLGQQVRLHVLEEEKELFPRVRAQLSGDELAALARELEQTYAELRLEGEPRELEPRAIPSTLQ
jgi:hemerythrin superfamily protein